MASKLEKRGDKWTFRYCKDGRNLRHTCFAFTKQEAEIEKVDFLHSLRAVKGNIPAKILFADMLKEFLNYVKTNKKNPAAYKIHLTALVNYLKPIYLVDINTDRLNDYVLTRLKGGLSKASINRCLGSISSFFTYLKNIKNYDIDNPVKRIKKFKLKLVVKTRVLTNEEIALIFSALDTGIDGKGKHLNTRETTRKALKAIFMLSLYAGLRLKECKLLKRENILFDKNSLIIEPQKTSESDPNPKTIPLHNKLREYLTALFKAEPADKYVA
ncbi:MAG: site-specific integrase, partial [Elusimicrobiota bacterium]|nr:site-specific integrase [Elusimicrobiota bacterium]